MIQTACTKFRLRLDCTELVLWVLHQQKYCCCLQELRKPVGEHKARVRDVHVSLEFSLSNFFFS